MLPDAGLGCSQASESAYCWWNFADPSPHPSAKLVSKPLGPAMGTGVEAGEIVLPVEDEVTK